MLRRKKDFFLKKAVAGVLTAALAMTTLTGTAFGAISYTAPEEAMKVDDDVVTGATAAANTVALSLLGIDVTSSNGAGVYNSSGSTGSLGTDSMNLGIFGSDLNDSPDPYLYNFFFNLSDTGVGAGDYSYETNLAWSAAPYTLLWEANKSGPTGRASGTTYIDVGGSYTAKTTNPAFYYEPDILLGGSTNGYASELATYQSTYNSSYNPIVFLGYGTSTGMYAANGSRSDGLGLEYNQFDMNTGLVYLGSVVQNMMNSSKETTRYDQSPYEIAVNYDKYSRGLYYYVNELISDGDLIEVRYATSVSYDSTEGYFVSEGTDRASQYASGIGEDIYDLLEAGYTFDDGTALESTTVTEGSKTTEGYYLTLDQMVEILNENAVYDEDSETTLATGVIVGSAHNEDTGMTALYNAGIRFLDDLPSCAYGITMQTVENGMGIPYYIGCFYNEQDTDSDLGLDPADYLYYWIVNFYHVSNSTSLQTIYTNMISECYVEDTCGYDFSSATVSGNYNATSVESQIVSGIAYYKTLGISKTSAEYWSSLNESVGIGSNVTKVNAGDYTYEVTDTFTDSYGNTIYEFTYSSSEE